MDPLITSCCGCTARVPRASGDGPDVTLTDASGAACSPRERGWTSRPRHGSSPVRVFPARAGMDLTSRVVCSSWRCVPRASGDGPVKLSLSLVTPKCSPRERGWTDATTGTDGTGTVFPARAGMDL